jgi:cytochrome c-type biogenesis protein CcmE
LKPKNQRLSLLILAIVCVLGAVLLAMSALRDQAAYFYAPGDMKLERPPVGRAIRVGGMVKAGSLKHKKDGVTIEFRIHDETQETIKVRFRGIPPDLFKEESGVVAEGRFQEDGWFIADEILAKHDENYRPPEASGEKHKSETLQ